MSEVLGVPAGFEHGSIVANGNLRTFSVLPHNIFEQAFSSPGLMAGEVNDKNVEGINVATEGLIFVSGILSGKYDSALGDSPQTAVIKNFISSKTIDL